MAANSLQVKEYIYLGNRVIAIDSTGPVVTSATVGTPLDPDKLQIPLGLQLDTGGVGAVDVINILVNTALDGRNACYFAFVPSASIVYLVNDDGMTLLPGVTFGSSTTRSNSQCSVTGTGITYSAQGTSATLGVTIQFNPNFKGNKVMYSALRTVGGGNTGWHSTGAIRVGKFGIEDPASLDFDGRAKNPAGNQNMVVTHSTDNTVIFDLWNPVHNWVGAEQRIANVLINSAIDGRYACYMAVVLGSPSALILVNDAGEAGGPFAGQMAVSSPPYTPIGNSQCQINSATQAISPDGKLLTVTLGVRYEPPFRGYRVFFPAIRIGMTNSGWFAGGSVQIN